MSVLQQSSEHVLTNASWLSQRNMNVGLASRERTFSPATTIDANGHKPTVNAEVSGISLPP